MPLYEYKCPVCEHTLEVYRSMDESKNPVYCPNCGAKMERYYGNQLIWNEIVEENNNGYSQNE